MKKLSFILAVLTAMTFGLFAEDETSDLTIVEKESKQASTSEVILTEDDFKLHNCESVGDALQTITGVFVSSTGEIGLRDVSSSKVVVILDGQRLNTAGGTGVNISSMPIDNVETIELLRGGRSAQYGADAVGGVIVVTSKKGSSGDGQSKKAFFGTKLSMGSYGKFMININNSLSLGKFSSFISYQHDQSTDNFSYEYIDYGTFPYTALDTIENNYKSSDNIFVKFDYTLNEKQNLSASFNHYGSVNGAAGMILQQTPNAVLEFSNQSYNLTYNNSDVFAGFSLKGQGYYLDNETKFNDPDNIFSPPSDHDNYALGLELTQAGSLLNDLLMLNYGYSYRNDRIQSTSVGSKIRNTHSGFATITGGLDFDSFLSRIEAALALRYDAPSDFANALSPRFSFSMAHNSGDFNANFQTHITRSYKAPSFNDLYWPQDAFAVGNPDLLAEYGFNYDIGLSTNYKTLTFAANFFSNDVTNLIVWQQDPAVNNLWTPKNISETSTKGIETSASATLWKIWNVNLEYTFMRALDVGPDPSRHGKLLTYKPQNKIDFNSSLKFSSIEWNLNYHLIDYRYTNPANTMWLPVISTFDTNIAYRFKIAKIGMNLVAEMINIFDVPVMITSGTASPGRLMKVALGANF
ncbi:MAG: TonB-dependent receptor [Candidatus Marinimicrobia bacterium]|nr:TonB-dependent receptor [Candidatus Neomarinimicrobiota bacterium]